METAFERILTHSYKSDMIAYMASHPESVEEAVQLALSDKQPYAWRAAWLLWSCMEDNDPGVRPHVKALIQSLPKRNDDQQRELLKILHRMEIAEKHHGFLYNHCVELWEKTGRKPSVRFTAFRTMVTIAAEHTELIPELRLLSRDMYTDSLSDTVKRSVHRMLKSLVESYASGEDSS